MEVDFENLPRLCEQYRVVGHGLAGCKNQKSRQSNGDLLAAPNRFQRPTLSQNFGRKRVSNEVLQNTRSVKNNITQTVPTVAAEGAANADCSWEEVTDPSNT